MEFMNVKIKDYKLYYNHSDCVLIDLREQTEYNHGHLPEAVSFPYDEFSSTDFPSNPFSRKKTLLLYCDHGNISMILSRRLASLGFHVINLYGGYNSYISS